MKLLMDGTVFLCFTMLVMVSFYFNELDVVLRHKQDVIATVEFLTLIVK